VAEENNGIDSPVRKSLERVERSADAPR